MIDNYHRLPLVFMNKETIISHTYKVKSKNNKKIIKKVLALILMLVYNVEDLG